MKKILIAMMTLTSLPVFADTLYCKVENQFADRSTYIEADVGIEMKTTALCNDGKYKVMIHGGGLGLYGALVDEFVVYCPFQTELAGQYYGLSIKAAFALGLGAGVFASSGGVCAIYRGSYGIGASVEAAELSIEQLD